MTFEKRNQPLAPLDIWCLRVIRSIGAAALLIAISLSIGVFGYHLLGKLSWVDSLLEASMILGGMGPVAPMQNDSVKLFASAYALFSGLVLLSTMGIVLGPWLHRMMHHFHDDVAIKKAGATTKK
jgi:hypothetical protein